MINELILTLPRTGSTYLGWLIYYHKYGLSDRTYIEHFHLDSINENRKNFFYKDVIEQLDNVTAPVLKLHNFHIDELIKHNLYSELFPKIKNSTVILMLRRNFYELCLSHAIAEKTNMWKHYENMPNDIEISIESFINIMNSKLHDIDGIIDKSNDFLIHKTVFYEDLLQNTQQDFEALDIGKCKYTGEQIPYRKAPDKFDIVRNHHDLLSEMEKFVANKTPKNFYINTSNFHISLTK